MFPDRQNDFVLSVGDDDVALIHQMPENSCGKDLELSLIHILPSSRPPEPNSRLMVMIFIWILLLSGE